MSTPRLVPVLLLGAVALLPACSTAGPRARDGALAGTVIGAGAGYAVGHHNHHSGKGTLIGAALGGLLGYAIGDSADHDRHGTHAYEDYTPPDPVVRERVVHHREVIVVHDHPCECEDEVIVVPCR